jgi:hypothetical protein
VFRPSTLRRTNGLKRDELNKILSRGESVLIEGTIYVKPEDIPQTYDHDWLKHPALPDGTIEVRQSDIDALETQGLIYVRTKLPTETSYFISQRGLAYCSELDARSECHDDSSLALVMKGGGVKGPAYEGLSTNLKNTTISIGSSARLRELLRQSCSPLDIQQLNWSRCYPGKPPGLSGRKEIKPANKRLN